jgi:putative redox protein
VITARELGAGYRNSFGNGRLTGQGDMPADKGGDGDGFRPHELLEAALATCMSMTVRIAAEKYAYPLTTVAVTVSLDRSVPDDFAFDYSLELQGDLSDTQRAHLARAAAQCPVSKTIGAKPRLRAASLSAV